MTDTILVLNAGSSSVKFSLFDERDSELALVAGGQVEGVFTNPVFHARDAAGQTVAERRWPTGSRLGHDGALAHITEWIQSQYARATTGWSPSATGSPTAESTTRPRCGLTPPSWPSWNG